ncbi:MAG TPA: GNAT family protein [Thermoplasmata archaeon]|nr:GNAT family protein [Thermoplasmata archaeon]
MRAAAFRPPLRLAGRYVDLIPLERAHADELTVAGRDPESQRYLVQGVGPSTADTARLVDDLLARQDAGTDLAFATRLRSAGRVVGMTRFLRLDLENDAVEIGGTFLDSRLWRTPVNTDAKLAMLRHAFEVGGAHRLTLQTDLRNERSQAAIAGLGAVREGVHREDRRLADGYRRSSVVFSILAEEWPAVQERLSAKLARPWAGPPPL